MKPEEYIQLCCVNCSLQTMENHTYNVYNSRPIVQRVALLCFPLDEYVNYSLVSNLSGGQCYRFFEQPTCNLHLHLIPMSEGDLYFPYI